MGLFVVVFKDRVAVVVSMTGAEPFKLIKLALMATVSVPASPKVVLSVTFNIPIVVEAEVVEPSRIKFLA
jgi:hypothetical protein